MANFNRGVGVAIVEIVVVATSLTVVIDVIYLGIRNIIALSSQFRYNLFT